MEYWFARSIPSLRFNNPV